LKKIITYGTFEMFHIGHLEILRRAKDFGVYLVVAVSTDEFNVIKG
jgi:glycerol-3-phosphate cytidylyltransferase